MRTGELGQRTAACTKTRVRERAVSFGDRDRAPNNMNQIFRVAKKPTKHSFATSSKHKRYSYNCTSVTSFLRARGAVSGELRIGGGAAAGDFAAQSRHHV